MPQMTEAINKKRVGRKSYLYRTRSDNMLIPPTPPSVAASLFFLATIAGSDRMTTSAQVGWLRRPLHHRGETHRGGTFDVASPAGRALLPTNGGQLIPRTEPISLPSGPM
jgi:hypothetical protein